MRFLQYLNEWQVKYTYAGRDVAGGDSPIIWMYVTKPNVGLIWSNTNGDVYLNNKKLHTIRNYSNRITHKYLLGTVYNKIEKLHLTNNLRDDVDTLVDSYSDVNIRGRALNGTIYIYSSGMMGGQEVTYKRLADKAVEAIYDYVPEEA